MLWDSHPLHLGATPRQVWIDGIPQLGRADTALTPAPDAKPVLIGPGKKGPVFKDVPAVPNWDEERKEAVEYEGLPPLGPKKAVKSKVVLRNVQEVWIRTETGLKERWSAKAGDKLGTVVLVNGAISCVGQEGWCLTGQGEEVEIDLRGGAVGPGLMTFGSPLGIEEITQELSTQDGLLYNPYVADTPKILGDSGAVVRAADALQFGTRNALSVSSPLFVPGICLTLCTQGCTPRRCYVRDIIIEQEYFIRWSVGVHRRARRDLQDGCRARFAAQCDRQTNCCFAGPRRTRGAVAWQFATRVCQYADCDASPAIARCCQR